MHSKVAWRLIPFLIFLFLLAWIDRVNVGFAKLQMLQDLRFSEAVYGLGAGIFFIGYFLFEVPSNLLLQRIGARKTLARITILWGLTSMAMAFVTTPFSFYLLRFLLGVFEAGFFPGVMLYLTYWIPAGRRGRINGWFMTSFGIAGVVGGPIAGLIMSGMDGVAPLRNWQWLFVLEGIPSVIAGIVVLGYLPDRPRQARWLSAAEQTALEAELEAEQRHGGKHASFAQALRQPALWLCTAAYFCIVGGNATLAFWMPSLVRELGVRGALDIGLLSAIPFTLGTVAMVLNGALRQDRRAAPALRRRHAGRRGGARADRRLHRQPGAGHGRAERIRYRRVGRVSRVLGDSGGLLDRHGRRRHRLHQLGRQPGGLRHALHDGLDEGMDRRRGRRPVRGGRHAADLDRDRRAGDAPTGALAQGDRR